MRSASAPRPKSEDRLLVVDAAHDRLTEARFDALDELLDEGDLVVVNDAAALPASIGFGRCEERAELRLLFRDELVADAIVLGSGDRRARTEERGPPPVLEVGQRLVLDGGLEAEVLTVDARSLRLVTVRLSGDARGALTKLYAAGRPIQYAYVPEPLALYDVQTPYAGRPWASEMPSAGRPLTFGLLGRLRARGVELARLTHGAGLSSTGDGVLDARLPLPERYRISEQTAVAVRRAKHVGRRVVAVGTSVVRALESAARPDGVVRAGNRTTDLVVDRDTSRSVVDAVLTGMHEIGTSHFSLLEAFADTPLLARAIEHGDAHGYLLHEFGDSMLVFGQPREARKVA